MLPKPVADSNREGHDAVRGGRDQQPGPPRLCRGPGRRAGPPGRSVLPPDYPARCPKRFPDSITNHAAASLEAVG